MKPAQRFGYHLTQTYVSTTSAIQCIAFAVIGPALLGTTPVGTATSTPQDAEFIFSRARDVWTAQQCPSRIDYVITVAALIRGSIKENHYHATYLYNRDLLHVNVLSDEDARRPYTPHGTRIHLSLGIGAIGIPLEGLNRALTARLNHDGLPSELVGVPMLKPSYSFGLSRRSLSFTSDLRSDPPFKVIGSVSTISRDYSVSLIGIDKLGGDVEANHLQLTPLRDPQRNRLRNLWIDPKTFSTLKAFVAGNFTTGPGIKTNWVVSYQNLDGCMIIDREVSMGTLDYGRGRLFENTTFRFDVEIDPAAYRPAILLQSDVGDNVLREP